MTADTCETNESGCGYDPAYGTPTIDGTPIPPPPAPTDTVCNHRAEQDLSVTCVLPPRHTGRHRDVRGRWWADANTVDETRRYLIPRRNPA
jgi:hypothetical protein